MSVTKEGNTNFIYILDIHYFLNITIAEVLSCNSILGARNYLCI